MPTSLKRQLGGGGLLKVSSASLYGEINDGETDDVVITCPANKYIRLTQLYSNSGTSSSGGSVSLTVGSRSVFSGKAIAGYVGTRLSSIIKVGVSGTPSGTAGGDFNSSPTIQGGRNENFVFSFNPSSPTSKDIIFSYDIMEDA